MRWERAGVAALALGVLLALVAGSLLIGHLVVDAGFAEARLREAFPRHRVSVGSADLGLFARSWTLADVRLEPVSRGGADVTGTAVTVDTVSVEGIGWLGLLLGGDYGAEEVRFAAPVIEVVPAEPGARADSADRRTADPAPPDPARSDSAADGGLPSRLVTLATSLPHLELDRLVVRRGRIRVDAEPGSAAGRTEFLGLDVAARDVRVDSAAASDTSRVLFSRHLVASLDSMRRLGRDSLSALTVGEVRVSTRDTALVVRGLRSGPTLPAGEFWKRIDHRNDYDRYRIERLVAVDLDLRRWAARRDLLAPLVRIEGLEVDVTAHKQLPPHPDGRPPLTRRLLTLGRTFAFDTVRARVGHGTRRSPPTTTSPGWSGSRSWP